MVQIHSPRPLQNPSPLIEFTQFLLRLLTRLCCGTMEQLKSPILPARTTHPGTVRLPGVGQRSDQSMFGHAQATS